MNNMQQQAGTSCNGGGGGAGGSGVPTQNGKSNSLKKPPIGNFTIFFLKILYFLSGSDLKGGGVAEVQVCPFGTLHKTLKKPPIDSFTRYFDAEYTQTSPDSTHKPAGGLAFLPRTKNQIPCRSRS